MNSHNSNSLCLNMFFLLWLYAYFYLLNCKFSEAYYHVFWYFFFLFKFYSGCGKTLVDTPDSTVMIVMSIQDQQVWPNQGYSNGHKYFRTSCRLVKTLLDLSCNSTFAFPQSCFLTFPSIYTNKYFDPQTPSQHLLMVNPMLDKSLTYSIVSKENSYASLHQSIVREILGEVGLTEE